MSDPLLLHARPPAPACLGSEGPQGHLQMGHLQMSLTHAQAGVPRAHREGPVPLSSLAERAAAGPVQVTGSQSPKNPAPAYRTIWLTWNTFLVSPSHPEHMEVAQRTPQNHSTSLGSLTQGRKKKQHSPGSHIHPLPPCLAKTSQGGWMTPQTPLWGHPWEMLQGGSGDTPGQRRFLTPGIPLRMILVSHPHPDDALLA